MLDLQQQNKQYHVYSLFAYYPVLTIIFIGSRMFLCSTCIIVLEIIIMVLNSLTVSYHKHTIHFLLTSV